MNKNESNSILSNYNSKFNDSEINRLLKEKIGYLNDLKKKYGYNQDLINKLALMNIALKDNNIEIDDLFYDTLMKTEIFIEKEDGKELSKKLKQKYNTNIDENISGIYTMPSPQKDLIFNDMSLFNINKILPYEPEIYLTSKYKGQELTEIEKYNTFIHEIRHALTSQRFANCYWSDDTYVQRSGIHHILYKKGKENSIEKNLLLNEAFNEHSTVQLMNTILNYSYKNLDNDEVIIFLQKLKKDAGYGYFDLGCYDYLRNLIGPILNNKNIVNLVDEVSYGGRIVPLVKLIPNLFDYGYELEYLTYKYLNGECDKEYKTKLKEFKNETNKIARLKI